MSLVGEAIIASINAMLKVIVVLLIGVASAHTGFLNTTFIPQLSNWVFMILIPCLILANLGSQLTIDKLALYWPVLVWGTYSLLLGYGVGWLYCFLFSSRQEYKTTIISAITYYNAVSLPLVILDSLCASSIFSDNPDGFTQATAICFLLSIPWNIIMYAVGYPYLLELTADSTNEDTTSQNNNNNAETDLDELGTTQRGQITGDYSHLAEIEDDSVHSTPHPLDIDIEQDPRYPPALAISGCVFTAKLCNRGCDFLGHLVTHYFLRHLSNSLRFVVVMMFTNPPMIATFVAFFLGLIPPIKDVFYESSGPLYFVLKAIQFVAQCAIPAGTLVTAANIYHSIQRNFGEDARKLQRVIDVIQEAQKAESTGQSLDGENAQPSLQPQTLPFTQNRNSFNDIELVQLGRDQNSNSLPHSSNSFNSSQIQRQNSSFVFPRDQSAIKIYFDDAAAVKASPYLVPTASTMLGADLHDMELIHRTHSRIKYEPTHFHIDQPIKDEKPLTAAEQILSRIDASFPIELDENGNVLPLPRLIWIHMLLASLCRLVIVPLIIFITMILIDRIGWTALLPDDTLYRTVILLSTASTSAEAVLMIVTKGLRVRPSMMLSLLYVVQYALCLVTIPIWLIIVISLNQPNA